MGLFLFNDIPAHRLLDLCRDAAVQVPDEVAVVTVGNDPILCSTTIPPASSIEHDAEQIGYEAASLLDKMMQGAPAPRRPVRIVPDGLVVRLSSDMLAVDDPDVAAALRCIHDHGCEGLAPRFGGYVAVSQSVLERKFLRLIGRTPKAEMLRSNLARPTTPDRFEFAPAGDSAAMRLRQRQVFQRRLPLWVWNVPDSPSATTASRHRGRAKHQEKIAEKSGSHILLRHG